MKRKVRSTVLHEFESLPKRPRLEGRGRPRKLDPEVPLARISGQTKKDREFRLGGSDRSDLHPSLH